MRGDRSDRNRGRLGRRGGGPRPQKSRCDDPVERRGEALCLGLRSCATTRAGSSPAAAGSPGNGCPAHPVAASSASQVFARGNSRFSYARYSPAPGMRTNSTLTPRARNFATALAARAICSLDRLPQLLRRRILAMAGNPPARCCAPAPGIAGRRHLAPQMSVAVGLGIGELAHLGKPVLAGALRPRLPLEHRLQGIVGVVERQVRLDQVHRQPLADALRRRLLAGVGSRAAAILESPERICAAQRRPARAR